MYYFGVDAVLVQRIGGGQHGCGLRSEPTGISGTEPDHGQPAGHGRRSQPGTRTMAK